MCAIVGLFGAFFVVYVVVIVWMAFMVLFVLVVIFCIGIETMPCAPILNVFITFPALCGAVLLFGTCVVVLVQRPNTMAVAWKDVAYICALGSVALCTLASWTWEHAFSEPPRPCQWLFSIATIIWLLHSVVDEIALSTVAEWPGIRGQVIGSELESIRGLFAERCREYANNYEFSLILDRAFQVSSAPLEEQFDVFCEAHRRKGKVSNRHQLFHGTARSSAKSIIEHGFRLPRHGGMFGKGLYFANTPLKSKQYTGWHGAILLCEVELGNSKTLRIPDNELAPETHLQRNWFMRAIGNRSFDSVTASDGILGCVRVPEYVIFKPEQVVPRYLLFVRQA